MEKHGIGTDASISTHIENILKRNYVELIPGRKLKPSRLGLVLAQGYHLIDNSLVLPQIRSDIEGQCNKIAKGLADRDEVVKKAIELVSDFLLLPSLCVKLILYAYQLTIYFFVLLCTTGPYWITKFSAKFNYFVEVSNKIDMLHLSFQEKISCQLSLPSFCFCKNINKMDVLFGSSFAQLQDVGKPFTRCGFTRRYLQFITGPPPRLYNKTTETVYPLPM